MVAEVARRKALATVLEKAKVVDADGNEVDLNALNTGEDAIAEGHEGHDHEGHDHEGHDHEGHDHGDHESHDHACALPLTPRGPRGRVLSRARARGLRRTRLQNHEVRDGAPCRTTRFATWCRAGPPGLPAGGACALTANRAGSRDFPHRAGR
jgi:G3E family GTPase